MTPSNPAPSAAPVRQLLPERLARVLERMTYGYGYPAADIATDLKIPEKAARAIMRGMEAFGWARLHPFFGEDDGLIRGSGYSLTREGNQARSEMLAARAAPMPNDPAAPVDALVTQEDREAAADTFCYLGTDMKAMREGLMDDESIVQRFARHRIAAEERAQRRGYQAATEHAAGIARVECVETLPIDWPFTDAETPPIWRVLVGEYCADFDFEEAARNFAGAINSAIRGADHVE